MFNIYNGKPKKDEKIIICPRCKSRKWWQGAYGKHCNKCYQIF